MATYIKTITAVLLLCPVLLFSQSKVVNMGSATKATPSFTSNDTAAYGLPYTIRVISGKSYKTSQSATIIITDNGSNAITDILLDGQYTYGARSVSISSVKVYGSDTVTLVSSDFTDIGLYNITISVQNPGHSVTIGGLTYRQYIEFGTGGEVLADTASAIRSDIPAGGIDRAELADSTEAIRNDFPTAGVDSAMLADTAAAIRGDFPSPGGGGGITDVTYAQLLAAISGGTLSAGGWYRITDFRTVHYFSDDESTIDTAINVGALEPLIVFATSDTAIANRAYSEAYPQDVIYYDYDSTHFLDDYHFSVEGAGDSIVNGFKGVITYRWDTDLDNYCGYDYRNVKFRRWALDPDDWSSATTYAAKSIVQDNNIIYISLDTTTNNIPASSSNDWAEIVDMTTNTYWAWASGDCNTILVDATDYSDLLTFGTGTCYMNHIEPCHDNGNDWFYNGTILNNIVFGDDCEGNYIGSGSYEMTFGDQTYSNVMMNYCYYNLCNDGFKFNTVYREFNSNVIDKNFIDNTFGMGCSDNFIGVSVQENDIAGYFTENIVGGFNGKNHFGLDCSGNIISIGAVSNSISGGLKYCVTSAAQYCEFSDVITSTTFIAEPLMSAAYNKTIQLCSDGTVVISYIDCSGSPTYTVRAVTLPGGGE